MNRVLITGAAGNIGKRLRTAWRGRYPVLRLSDIADLGPAEEGEEVVPCDLGDRTGVEDMMREVDAVVHLGGIALEDTFDRILAANIVGTYNVFEAARRQRVERIVFASTSHVGGFYKRTEVVGLEAPFRPDTLYGVSKAFGEVLARYYFDKFGLQSASIRIGTFEDRPFEERHLSTWVSPEDLVELIERCLIVRPLGCAVVYGVSANSRSWWNNDKAAYLGYRPKCNAEDFAEDILRASPPVEPGSPELLFQGGSFVARDDWR